MANLQRENGPEIVQDGDFAEARWKTLSRFGLDRPSGDLKRDLDDGKKILLQRGLNVREILPMPDMGKGVIQFVASTDGVKRDGNEVVNTGWNFHGFEQNPAFLWSHDYRSLPIGKHVDWKVEMEGNGTVLRVWSQFVEEEDYPFAGRVQKMYEKGFLRAVSIGWNPLKWEYRVDDEGEIQGYRFTENDLLEVSAVSVPSDPDAIVEAINKRVINTDDVELMARSGALPKLSRKIAYTLSNFEPLKTEARTEEGTEVKETETEVEVKIDGEKVADAVAERTEEVVDEAPSELEIANKRIEELEAAAAETSEEVVEVAKTETREEDPNDPVEDGEECEDTPDPTDVLREAVGKAASDFADNLVTVIGETLGRDFGMDKVDETPEETADEVIENEEKRSDTIDDEELTRTVSRFKELNEAIDIAEGRLGSKLSRKTRSTLGDVAGALEKAQSGINSLLEQAGEAAEEVDETASAEGVTLTRKTLVIEPEVVEEDIDFDAVQAKIDGLSRELGVPNEDDVLARLTNFADGLKAPEATTTREVSDEPKSEFVSDLFDKLDILKKSI